MNSYAIITFYNSHFALKAKKVLENNCIKSETIPVPRELSSECGFCCKILWKDKDLVEELLNKNNIAYENIYKWENKLKNRKFNIV